MVSINLDLAMISSSERPSIGNARVAQTIRVDDHILVECNRSCPKFAKFVRNDFSMLAALVSARTAKCSKLMEEVNQASSDPTADSPDSSQPPVKRAKRELIDEIACDLVEVSVRDHGDNEYFCN
eukprot:1573240-Pyramimonas_sp.AAC.1